MEKTILTKKQHLLLELLATQPYIQQHFYLSGGTALSEYYLHHRLSEDLDFFSLEEVSPKTIQIIFRKIKQKINLQKVVYQQSFNRNLFYLHFSGEVIKTEFTYYPFEQIEQPKKIDKLKIDSLIDIAVNKADTIVTRPRSRDFIDLYLILKKKQWEFNDLLKAARIKFDIYSDPLHMVQQLIEVTKVRDFPRMIIPFEYKECEDFWLQEAAKLKKDILQ